MRKALVAPSVGMATAPRVPASGRSILDDDDDDAQIRRGRRGTHRAGRPAGNSYKFHAIRISDRDLPDRPADLSARRWRQSGNSTNSDCCEQRGCPRKERRDRSRFQPGLWTPPWTIRGNKSPRVLGRLFDTRRYRNLLAFVRRKTESEALLAKEAETRAKPEDDFADSCCSVVSVYLEFVFIAPFFDSRFNLCTSARSVSDSTSRFINKEEGKLTVKWRISSLVFLIQWYLDDVKW